MLRGRGGVVYLEVDPALAWARAEGSGRPNARDRAQFDALLEKRRGAYESVADWATAVGTRTVDDISREIAEVARSTGAIGSKVWGRRIVSTSRPSLILGGKTALLSLRDSPYSARPSGTRLFVVTDENVMRAWGDRVLALLGAGASTRDSFGLGPARVGGG